MLSWHRLALFTWYISRFGEAWDLGFRAVSYWQGSCEHRANIQESGATKHIFRKVLKLAAQHQQGTSVESSGCVRHGFRPVN